jgi:hypothetical protein
MLPTPIDLDQAHERHEEYAADALQPKPSGSRVTTIRRAIGHRFIVVGQRIASDPRPALARGHLPTTMR